MEVLHNPSMPRRRIVRIAVVAVSVLAVPLAVGGWAVRTGEPSHLFRPVRGPVGASPGEDVRLTASDGVRLHAWHLPRPDAPWSILWLHGNGGNLGHQREIAGRLTVLAADFLMLDYRGYGESEGAPTEEGVYRDAQAAYEWLAERRGAGRVVIVGESLGGAIAAEIAANNPCAGVVLQSTFTSAPDLAADWVPWFPVRWFVGSRFDTLSKLSLLGVPKLVVHGRRDVRIPFAHGERLFEAAPEPKSCAWLERAGHDDVWSTHGGEFLGALEKFLASLKKN